MAKLKLGKAAGRYGVRYGVSVRRKIAAVEERQRKKQKCLFCSGKAKRLSKGIWLCGKCGKKFASHTYYLEQEYKSEDNSAQNAVNVKKDKDRKEAEKKEDLNTKTTKLTKSKTKPTE